LETLEYVRKGKKNITAPKNKLRHTCTR